MYINCQPQVVIKLLKIFSQLQNSDNLMYGLYHPEPIYNIQQKSNLESAIIGIT